MLNINLKEIKRILIIRLAMIGDVVLATPLIRQLRKKFPKTYITFIAGEKAAPILENNPHINELAVSDKKIFYKIGKKEKYDLAIDLMGVNATARLCTISGAKYKVGIYGRRFRDYNIIFDKNKKGINVMDYFFGLLDRLDIKNSSNKKTEIFLTQKEKKFADKVLKDLDKKIVGIQPACNLKGRLWNERNFAKLADILINRSNLNVIIFQGPGEEKIALKMKKYMKQKATLLPVMKLRKYLAILNKCSLFIANEGGQLHMAMALDIPTIGIFGPSRHAYWFYYKKNFKKVISENINDISVERVFKKIEKWK